MSVKMKTVEYGSPKQILAIPDHYVAFGYKHNKAVSGNQGLAVLEDGRYIVKAGTIYPANDSTAIGVILNDYDVTDGDQVMAVVIHGFIKIAALPAVPTANAISAMKQIVFSPLTDMGIALTGTKAAIAVGATTDPDTVTFTLANAAFRDKTATETLTNWTIAGESTTKVSVTAISLSDDKKSVTFTLEQSAAAVSGNVTVIPAASLINTGKTVSAVTIATVA